MTPTEPRPHPKKVAADEFREDRVRLALILFVAMVGALIAWWIPGHLTDSALYFITIPGSMAILIAALPSPTGRTDYGLWRQTTIAVLASAILLREGFICVLMALPLIVPLVAFVSWSTKSEKRWRQEDRKRLRVCVLPLLLLGLGAEGVVFDLPNRIEASETRVVQATPEELRSALAATGELPELEPLLFALPFPRPTAFVGDGGDVGDHRIVEFGDDGHITLLITDWSDTSIRWTIVEDTTAMAGWLRFEDVTATWSETPDGLDLTVTVAFERKLSPAFYFDPLQRWGVGEMAEVLVDMVEHNLQGQLMAYPDA